MMTRNHVSFKQANGEFKRYETPLKRHLFGQYIEIKMGFLFKIYPSTKHEILNKVINTLELNMINF